MSNAAVLPAEAAPAKGKGKLIVIVVAVLALAAIGGGGAAWYFHQKAAAAEASTEGDEGKPAKTKKAEAGKPPVFMTLENFTVNLVGGDHFMQLGLVLQLKDEETAEKVKAYLPMIRNKVLLLLSSKTSEEVESPKGKQALIDEILASAREPLHAEGDHVQAVLLGSMLVQ